MPRMRKVERIRSDYLCPASGLCKNGVDRQSRTGDIAVKMLGAFRSLFDNNLHLIVDRLYYSLRTSKLKLNIVSMDPTVAPFELSNV